MYRIEVKPGEETVFRTIEELSTGIRNGFITSRARIYHAASQKWLPIEFHPHYKKALDGNFTPSAAAPQPSLTAMPAPTFSFPGATAPQSPPPAAEPPAAEPAHIPEPDEAAASLVVPPPTAASPRRARAETPAPAALTAAQSPLLAMHAAVHRAKREPEPETGPVERYSPVAVLEAPRSAPAPAPAPEVVLPNITYPELPPTEQPEPRATARRSRRAAGRPLLLVGSAAVLVFAGQRFLASRAEGSTGAATVTEASTPAGAPEPASPAPVARVVSAPKPAAPAPARSAPTPPNQSRAQEPPPSRPMTPGPAFAASAPARVAPGSPLPGSAPEPPAAPPAVASRPAPRPDSAAIAPAPTVIELDVPALVPGESIAPTLDNGRDSLALKRILKAVSGRKANPTAP
jgi:hypothetical protein